MDIKHGASEMHPLDASVPNRNPVRRNSAADSCIRRCLSQRAIVGCAVFLGFLCIILTVIIIRETMDRTEQDAGKKCSSCHPGWLLNEGVCYYISTEERNWTSSQDFCTLHSASLARIENEEKDFVMRYKKKVPYWIGLTRHSRQPWKWLNGDPAMLEVLGEGENCAFLSDEEEAKASVSRCSSEHHWICSGPAYATGT